MRIILVKDKEVLVDDDVFEWAKNIKWYFSNGYIIARDSKRLQRLIMQVTDNSLIVDHIDGNKLNNLRSNLRICTQLNNCRNRSKSKKQLTSRFKGVYRNPENTWIAQIRVNYKVIYLGTHPTEDVAAAIYNDAAKEYFGEYAKLNII